MFQTLVIKDFIHQQNTDHLTSAYEKFIAHFHNADIQTHIKNSKEEQYQEGFLRDLFVNILGYTLNPQPNFNLTTELKNQKGQKKCDGAILKNNTAICVIELKGMDTTNLDKIESQAFGYKNNQMGCRYVITSNFQKLRFYIDNSVEYLEFDLFKLNFDEFCLLYTLLYVDNLLNDIPLKLKQASISQEEKITKALYKDYSEFKRVLFADFIKNNGDIDQLTLFNKTQKLLDRLLFIFFAEDSRLLPANTAHNIIKEYEKAKELNIPITIYSHLKNYFNYLNAGYKTDSIEIFAYNGGLFKPDVVLDNLVISDDILYHHIKKLADYDFKSEIDVNILGHIFENSLNEIDEIKASLNGETLDKTNTKRKKDGVFYTPKYITSYIVQNTVGKLCNDKKQALGIIDSDYYQEVHYTKTGKRKKLDKDDMQKQKTLYDNLIAYRNWLLSITICDPACGSGAFLNEALNFLIGEHRYIDELESKLTGSSLTYQNVANHILENNLFGVDINEESVQIAKLSLWLRTAEPHRKLSNLNENIKCGNSLIADKNIAGDKAFDWQKEFPKVFDPLKNQGGGFDVVIGNPPYVRAELLPNHHIEFYKNNYQVFNGSGDLFSYFYELGFKILKENGLFGFISNTFDKTNSGISLRNYLKNSHNFLNYVDFTQVQIFEGATTYPIIIIAENSFDKNNDFDYIKIPKSMQDNIDIVSNSVTKVFQKELNDEVWLFRDSNYMAFMERLKKLPTLKDIYGKCYFGIKTGLNEAFIIDKNTRDRLIAQDKKCADIIEPIYEGKDLNKWVNPLIDKYVILTHNGYDDNLAIDLDNYPIIKEYLDTFEPKLSNRYDKGKTVYNLRNCAYQKSFYKPKIVWTNLQNSNKFSFDDKRYIINAPACLLPTDSKALLAVLNSKLVWFFLSNICVVRNGGYIEVKPQYFENIPIAVTESNEIWNKLEIESQKMIDLTVKFQTKNDKILRTLTREFDLTEFSKSLQNWHLLSFKDFVKELEKKKVKLSLAQKSEWEEFFMDAQKEILSIQTDIDNTDTLIN